VEGEELAGDFAGFKPFPEEFFIGKDFGRSVFGNLCEF